MTKVRDLQELLISILDIITVFVSLKIISLFDNSDITTNLFWVFPLIHLVTFYVTRAFKHFFRRGYFEEFKSIVHYSVIFLMFITFLVFMSKGDVQISRRGITAYIVLNSIFTYVLHLMIKVIYGQYSKTEASKKVFLITTMDRVKSIKERLEFAKIWGGTISGITIVDNFKVNEGILAEVFPNATLVDWDNRVRFATQNVVDEVFINVAASFDNRLVEIIYPFEEMGIDTSVNIRAFELDTVTTKKIRTLGGFQVVTLSHKFYNQFDLIIKRLVDIIGGLVGVILAGIISIFLVPMIILESPGKPIYAQNRVGTNGRIFKFYKFRSMYKNADEIKAQLMEKNEMSGLMFKLENDPRITKVGKFIRKTSIDEFPQFWNVLRGDMSLVGTRPPTEDEYLQYNSHHKRRLSFKPGITGLWQVSGRNEITEFDDVVKLDVEYINNWSLWLDLKILLLTLKVVFIGKGAK